MGKKIYMEWTTDYSYVMV